MELHLIVNLEKENLFLAQQRCHGIHVESGNTYEHKHGIPDQEHFIFYLL